MKTAEQIQNELPQFYGTETWHRYNPILFPNVLLTDGATFIADNAGAYWLIDAISSYIPYIKGGWALARLTVKDNKGILTIDDGTNSIITQEYAYTDFPLDEIEFNVVDNDEAWVICLPSEN